MKSQLIIEKKLGISGDYQYRALRSKNFLQSNWHYNKLQALRILLNLNKNLKVLDLGIGSGNFEFEFAGQVQEITGVDYNDEAIIFAKDQLTKLKIKNVDLITDDIRNITKVIKLKKFDLILFIDIIEHLRFKDARRVIRNLRTLLKKNGRVCVITPNYNSPWHLIEVILDKIQVLPKLKGEQHLAKFHRTNLTQLFKSERYKTEVYTTFNLFSYLVPNKTLSTLLLRLELHNLLHGGNLLLGIFRKE